MPFAWRPEVKVSQNPKGSRAKAPSRKEYSFMSFLLCVLAALRESSTDGTDGEEEEFIRANPCFIRGQRVTEIASKQIIPPKNRSVHLETPTLAQPSTGLRHFRDAGLRRR